MNNRTLALSIAALLPVACTGGGSGDGSGESGPPPSTSTSGPGEGSTTGGLSGATTGSTLDGGTTPPGGTTTTGENESLDGPIFDVAGVPDMGPTDSECNANTDATLTGTVLAPNGEIPIFGALVYTSVAPPAGIPQEVYCDECQQIDCNNVFEYTFTDINGEFTLPAVSGNDRYLVVQKGQFMRIPQIDVDPGPATLPDAQTTLPGANDPAAGEYIPLIAVGHGSYDRIEDALGKFGMGQTNITGFEQNLVPGTEPFDIWDNGGGPAADGFTSQGTFAELINDPDALANYHIIFVPCSTDSYLDSLNATTIQNIRDWVGAGGRWYVADWSNEWMEHVFPDYQTLQGEPNAADLGSYDANATVLDMNLLDWLMALPPGLKDINPLNDEMHPTLNDLPAFVTTVDNFSVVQMVHPILVDDGEGGMIDVGHKVWLEGSDNFGGGPPHPLTITGQFGCGRIQFTSYHAAEFFDYVGLSPQELVLLYTILEIGVCQENPVPPPVG